MLDFGFYNMDCMEGMKEFPDQFFDLAICDPPYGISYDKQIEKMGGTQYGIAAAKKRTYHTTNWDKNRPDKKYFNELMRVSKKQIIWGGNYFLDNLGATECLIVWDKKRRGLNFADCEIAWTNIKEPCRIFEWKWNGMLQEDMKNKEYRIHPTQKPVALYRWLLEHYAKEGDKILDTHVGSASSLIACREMGFKYVGFEIDEDYFNEAKKRLDQAENQVNIFDLL